MTPIVLGRDHTAHTVWHIFNTYKKFRGPSFQRMLPMTCVIGVGLFYFSTKIWQWKLACGTQTEKCTITRRNPRYDHLYMDEDFMKHISRIASRTHPNTMDKVVLHRYRALIELCMWPEKWGPRLNPANHPRARWYETSIGEINWIWSIDPSNHYWCCFFLMW